MTDRDEQLEAELAACPLPGLSDEARHRLSAELTCVTMAGAGPTIPMATATADDHVPGNALRRRRTILRMLATHKFAYAVAGVAVAACVAVIAGVAIHTHHLSGDAGVSLASKPVNQPVVDNAPPGAVAMENRGMLRQPMGTMPYSGGASVAGGMPVGGAMPYAGRPPAGGASGRSPFIGGASFGGAAGGPSGSANMQEKASNRPPHSHQSDTSQPTLWIIRPGSQLWPRVEKELGLSDEQKEKISEWQDEMARQPSWHEMQSGPSISGGNRQRLLMEILGPEQWARLKGISLQALGCKALTLPDIVEQLEIRDDQVKKIEKVGQQLNMRLKVGQPQFGPPRSRDEVLETVRKARQEQMDDLMKVLTPKQRREFNKLIGKSSDVNAPQNYGAQQFNGPGGGMPVGPWSDGLPPPSPPASKGILLHLLQLAVVQKELNLSDQQQENIKEWTYLGDRGQDAWISGWADWGLNLAGLLKHDQLKRLREIWLQTAGPAELRLLPVMEELKIAGEQQEQIAELQRNYLAATHMPRGLGPPPSSDELKEWTERRRKAPQEARDGARKVLTAEQRQKFEEMMGKKINLNLFERQQKAYWEQRRQGGPGAY